MLLVIPASQDVGRDARLTPGGVRDALVLGVLLGCLDEPLLHGVHVGLHGHDRQLVVQVAPLLEELEPAGSRRLGEVLLHDAQALADAVGGALATPAGSVPLECIQVGAYGIAEGTAMGQGGLVLGGHRASLTAWGHLTPLLPVGNRRSRFSGVHDRARLMLLPVEHGLITRHLPARQFMNPRCSFGGHTRWRGRGKPQIGLSLRASHAAGGGPTPDPRRFSRRIAHAPCARRRVRYARPA